MQSLLAICETGDELEQLKQLRRIIAMQLDTTDSGRDVAALSNRYIETCEKISELEKANAKSRRKPIDTIRAKRKTS